ncbi:MAG TPA: glycosyltransferase [Baekduia sp.]|uniref:glycosyltransferase n=1 Tax=Baekduia sp. TaxID=2600305 RepID=UPI002D76E3D6|nr:glycosyltransferase [Baekduia sp.]HET6506422.1 glycosyltransferase [Baekduia sp.]
MPRFLIATLPADGHFSPLLPLATELTRRGHEVFWLSGQAKRARVEATGAAFLPFIDAWDLDFGNLDATFPGRAEAKGVARFKYDMREIFIKMVPDQIADLERHVANVRPDLLIVEPTFGGAAAALEERCGLRWATFGIGPLMMPSPDAPPFGLGLTPLAHRTLNRARNRALNTLIDRTLFRSVDADYRAMCARVGISPNPGGLFAASLSPHLYLHPSVPSFEYPRSNLPAQVCFVGPHLPAAPASTELPEWWGEMLTDERPVVLVTQGTVATDPDELLTPTLRALEHEPVQVIAVTGGPEPTLLPPAPANARVARYIPFAALMPHVDVYVTNGGYGGLHFAMSHGVPVLSVGATEDKPDLAARVSWSGVGIGMRAQWARPDKVRAAVRRLLDEDGFRARAQELADEMAACDGPARASELVEALAARRYAAAGAGSVSGALAGVSA